VIGDLPALMIATFIADDFVALLGEASGLRHAEVARPKHSKFHRNSPLTHLLR
jgi:hypothetical protein